jgi:ribose transport system permease protein
MIALVLTQARTRFGHFGHRVLTAANTPIFIVLGVIYLLASVVVSVTNQGTLLSLDALDTIMSRSVGLGIVAMGQTVALVVGSIDLSVAYLISVGAVYSSAIMQNDPNRMVIGVLAVLAIGALVGLVNGLVITKLRVNAFVATLGMSFILSGVLNASFQDYSGAVPDQFQTLAYGYVGPIRVPFILLAAVILAVWVLLRYTTIGHHMYAVGGNEETARLSGIRSHRVIITAHVICSITAILTGLYLAARIKSGAPWIGPDGHYDLESIAAVVVGGTALSGGRGGVWGTVAGVMILFVLDTSFNSLQVNEFLQDVARGLIIIGAVAVYTYREYRRRR